LHWSAVHAETTPKYGARYRLTPIDASTGGCLVFGPIDLLALAGAALPVGVLVGVLVWRGRRRRPSARRDAWVDGAIAGWLAAVMIATLSPLTGFGALGAEPDVVLVPFRRLPGAPVAYAVINLLLLAPLGLLLTLRGARPALPTAIGFGVVTSFGIEVLQLFHAERGTNVDDLILNTAGVVVGALLGAVLRPVRAGARRRRSARLGTCGPPSHPGKTLTRGDGGP
jgi:hypothetical protein